MYFTCCICADVSVISITYSRHVSVPEKLLEISSETQTIAIFFFRFRGQYMIEETTLRLLKP